MPSSPAEYSPFNLPPWDKAFAGLQGAIRQRDLNHLRLTLANMQVGRIFLPPAKWVELAKLVAEEGDGGFLREIWIHLGVEGSSGTVSLMYGPALTEFASAAIACGVDDILRLILKQAGSAGVRLGTGWRALMNRAIEMRAARMLCVLAEEVQGAYGHLHYEDVEGSILLLVECNEIGVLKLMLKLLPTGPGWAASWERVGGTILTQALKPIVPKDELIHALLEVTDQKSWGLSPEHYRSALSGAGRTDNLDLFKKVIRHAFEWGGFQEHKDDILSFAHFCIASIGDKPAFLEFTLSPLGSGVIEPPDYEQLLRTGIQHAATATIEFLGRRLASETVGGNSLRIPVWQSLFGYTSGILQAGQCGAVALAIWRACVSTNCPFSPAVCSQAMDIFVRVSHAEGIQTTGLLMKARQLFLVAPAWQQMLNKALKNNEFSATAAQALWDASEQSHSFFQQSHWNSFAELKERLQSEEVGYVVPGEAQRQTPRNQAEEFVRAFEGADWETLDKHLDGDIEQCSWWSPDIARRISAAMAQDRSEKRIRAFWRMARALTRSDDYRTFRFFVRQVNKDGSAGLLDEIFDTWEPSEDTLRGRDTMGGEHQTWISFIQAASDAGDEELLLRIVRRLDWLHDPTRYDHLGPIQIVLRQARTKLKSKVVAEEIARIIHGKHWNPIDFLGVMAAWPPKYVRGCGSRFDGAARCLMKWLVNRYFDETPDEFEHSLELIADGISRLPRHVDHAWCALLGRGWDVMTARIHQFYQGLWEKKIGALVQQEITREEFLSKVLSDEVLGCYTSFIHEASSHARVSPNGLDSSTNDRAIELTDYIAENLERNMEGKGLAVEDFWEGLRQHCAVLKPETLTSTEQRSFLRYCLRKLECSLQALVGNELSLKIHDGKGRFMEDFLAILVDRDVPHDEKLKTAGYAMEFLGDLSLLGSTLRPGSLTSANLTRRVRAVLVQDLVSRGFKPEVTLTDALSIAIPDSGRQELLEPILEDVTRNIRDALNQVEDDQRFVSITLTRGTSGRSGFAVLEIWNAKPDQPLRNAASTSLGLKSIQRRMSMLFNGRPNERGSANFSEAVEPFSLQTCFVSRLNFPLSTKQDHALTGSSSSDMPDTDYD